jgi:cytochrome P450
MRPDTEVVFDPDTYVFGHGPHFCLGAHLARVQTRELFAEVLRRTSALRGAGRPDRLRSNFQHGVKHLPVAWTAGQPTAST